MAAGKQSAWTGCSRFTSFHNKKCQHQAIKASAPSFNLSWTLSPQLFLQSTGSCDSMQSSHQLRPRIFVAFDGPLWRQPSDTCHGPLFGPLEHSACASDIKWLSALNASWFAMISDILLCKCCKCSLLRYYTRVSGRLTAVGRSPASKSNPLYTTMFWMFQYTAKQTSGKVDTSTLVKREDSPQHMDMLNLCEP